MPQDKGPSMPVWLPTGQAAAHFGVSPSTLKRYAKRDGFLQEGTHFHRGVYPNSPLIWHVSLCIESFRRGAQARDEGSGVAPLNSSSPSRRSLRGCPVKAETTNQPHPLDTWLPTGKAVCALCRSADTLKRYALRDGVLIEGQHWRRGAYRQSPMVWNVRACEQAIALRGR